MPPLPSLLVFILSLLRKTLEPSFFPILPVPKHGAPVGLFLPRDLPASFAASPHPLALPDTLPILVVHPVKLPWLIKCRSTVGAVADGFRSLWVLSRRMPSAFPSHAPSQNGMSSSHWDGCAARPTASCRSAGNMLVSSIFCFSACGVPNCPKPLCVGPSL